MKKIAALFVETTGVYSLIDYIDLWDITRDARQYTDKLPIIAHPPCERWGKYWFGGPNAKVRKKLGDDNGCFEAALKHVRKHGGVIEHPAYTAAWKHFNINRPPKNGGWVPAGDGKGFTCHVEQGNYGHRAQKATWLYGVDIDFKELKWGPSNKKVKLDDGFHTREERQQKIREGYKPVEKLSKKERIATPIEFRDLLISLIKIS